VAVLKKEEKSLLKARLEQLKKEAVKLDRERKEAAKIVPKLKSIRARKPKDFEVVDVQFKIASAETNIAREMLEREREYNNIEALIGTLKEEEFDLKEVKTLITRKGLKAKVHTVLQDQLPEGKVFCLFCATSCVMCASSCVACTTKVVKTLDLSIPIL
jgi:hypothetical protein